VNSIIANLPAYKAAIEEARERNLLTWKQEEFDMQMRVIDRAMRSWSTRFRADVANSRAWISAHRRFPA